MTDDVLTERALPEEAPPPPSRIARLRVLLGGISDYDLTAPLPFLLFAAVYILARIPWMRMGYGTDPDAWRVALTGKYLWAHGEYWPSRLPGYPLHEFITALFVPLGSFWSNLATAFVSLAGVWLFGRLLVHLRLPMKPVLLVGFAFAPLLWINSTATMDYMWALTFILFAYLLVIKGNAAGAGVALGLAAGFRLSSLAMLVPLGYYLLRTGHRPHMRGYVVAALATTIAAYMPVLSAYGLGMFNFYDAKVPLLSVIRMLGKEALGIIGATAVLAGLLISLPRLRGLPRDVVRDPDVGTWVLAIAVEAFAFGRLPHEIAYLIPVFAFGFFLMARYYYPALLVPVVAVILLAGFVDVTTPGDEINRDSLSTAEVGRGLLLSDLDTMRAQRAFADEVRDAEVSPRSFVMVGFIYPQFVIRNWDRLNVRILDRDMEAISMLSDRGEAVDRTRDVHYVWLLKYDTFRKTEGERYNVYYVADAARSSLNVFGYRPGYFNANQLQLSRDNPSEGRGGAATTER